MAESPRYDDIVRELRLLVDNAGQFPELYPVAPKRQPRIKRHSATRVAATIGMASVTAFTSKVASAQWNSSGKTVSQSAITAGDISLTAADRDASQPWLTTINDLYPSSSVYRERAVNVTIGGNVPPTHLSFNVLTNAGCSPACTTSALSTDATNGVQVSIDVCSVAWTASGGSYPGDKTYTCSGAQNSVLSETPLATLAAAIGTDITTNSNLTLGATNYYRMRYRLPLASANTTQGLTSTIVVKFLTTQRAATVK